MTQLYMGGVNYETRTGAPWVSTEIFTVGCEKSCPGCINNFFNEKNAKHRVFEAEELADILIEQVPYRKLTISGGEPFLQAEGLCELIYHLKRKSGDLDGGWKILCYSGYTFEELREKAVKDLFIHWLLLKIDILVDGPFVQELAYPKEEFTYVGSSNQRIIDPFRSVVEDKVILYGVL